MWVSKYLVHRWWRRRNSNAMGCNNKREEEDKYNGGICRQANIWCIGGGGVIVIRWGEPVVEIRQQIYTSDWEEAYESNIWTTTYLMLSDTNIMCSYYVVLLRNDCVSIQRFFPAFDQSVIAIQISLSYTHLAAGHMTLDTLSGFGLAKHL